MNAKVTKFYEAVSADDALQEEFAQVTDSVDVTGVSEAEAREAVAKAVAAFAVAHDLDLSTEDILASDASASEGELSEVELEAVSGGGNCMCVIIGAVKGCGCFIYGQAGHQENPEGKGVVQCMFGGVVQD